MTSLLREVAVEPGAVLIRAGELAPALMLVLEGTAEVRPAGAAPRPIGPGAWIGEESLVGGDAAVADVVAVSALRVAMLSGRQFLMLIDSAPALALSLLRGMNARAQGASHEIGI